MNDRKIVEYQVIFYREDMHQDFEKEICTFISEGWQPYGNPFIDGEYIHQAMVKYEDELERTLKGCI